MATILSPIISSTTHLPHHSTSKSFKTQLPNSFKLTTNRSQPSLRFQSSHLISIPRQPTRLFSVAEETPVAVATPDPSSEAARRLYVGNFFRKTTNDELQKLFEEHGAVEKVEIMYDKYSGRSRRFGFVMMKTVDDANAAIEKLDGMEIEKATKKKRRKEKDKQEIEKRKIKVNITEKPLTGGSISTLQAEEAPFIDSPYKLYVGNLAKTVTSDTLKSFFAEKGNVLGAKVSRVPGTSKSSGFGFVSFSSEEEVEAAISSFNDAVLEGQKIRVNKA